MTTEANVSESIERLQAEVSRLREFAMMQTALLQLIAVKVGVAPREFQASSPVPIPTPFDLQEQLREPR
jgi:hypothetical protein